MGKNNCIVGILGGMGPLATAYFYELIIKHTLAESDSDHVDLVISGTASTPDRTTYILNRKEPNPKETLVRDLDNLIKFGAKAIAIPCNTAHYFYDDLINVSTVPIFNMIEDTAKLLQLMDVGTVGILATKGTIDSRLYQRALERNSLHYKIPSENHQTYVTRIIYEQIKKGKEVDMNLFKEVIGGLTNKGCQAVILGCTELSTIKTVKQLNKHFYIDPLETLAYRVIKFANKKPCGFSSKMNSLNTITYGVNVYV